MLEVVLFACWFSASAPQTNVVEEFHGCQLYRDIGTVETYSECRGLGNIIAQQYLNILKKGKPEQIPQGITWCQAEKEDS